MSKSPRRDYRMGRFCTDVLESSSAGILCLDSVKFDSQGMAPSSMVLRKFCKLPGRSQGRDTLDMLTLSQNLRLVPFFILLVLLPVVSISAQSYQALSSVEGAASYTLAYAEDLLYSGEGNTLSIYDIGPGTAPPYERIFRTRFLSFIDDLLIQDGALWVSANTAGLFKFDLSDAHAPELVASWKPPVLSEAVYDIAVIGDTVFVANKTRLTVLVQNGNTFDRIVDLLEVPENVSRIRGCDVGQGMLAFTVATMSIVPGPNDGVHLYDAKTLTPVAYHRETYGDHEDVIFAPSNGLLHVMGGGQWTSSLPFPFSDPRGHYYILDISVPTQPVDVYHDTIAGISIIGDSQVIDAELINDTIWLATRTGDDQIFPLDGNVFVYDTRHRDSIALLADIGVGLLHFDLALQGSILHVASEWFGIRSIDISDVYQPVDLGDTRTGGWTETTDIHDNLMVQANEGFATQLFDISDPNAPELVGKHINIEDGFNFGAQFSEDGQYIFATYLEAGNSSEFRVLDVETMEVVGDLDFLTGFEDAFVFDTTFVAFAQPILGASYLSFVSVSNPLQPFLLGTLPMSVNDMKSLSGYAAICRDDALVIIRLQDQELVESIPAMGEAFFRVAVQGEEVYAVREDGVVEKYHWDPTSETLDFIDSPGMLELGVPTHIAVDDQVLHVGYTEFGLFAMDKTSLEARDAYRTGLDLIFPFWWELENVQVFDDLIAVTEYFGQTTLLSFSDTTTTVSDPRLVIEALDVYPNPARGTLTIQTTGLPCVIDYIQVVNSEGRILYNLHPVGGFATLDLPSGTFFLRGISDCGTIHASRVVVFDDE